MCVSCENAGCGVSQFQSVLFSLVPAAEEEVEHWLAEQKQNLRRNF